MSSQKGNVARSRPQKHQNTFSFKNDKFDKSVQTKKINAKLHDGVCQRCKEVLEWRVKYSKYKPLSKPKKCARPDEISYFLYSGLRRIILLTKTKVKQMEC
ncbi:uncharacterized protein C9orf85 isoform X2 [Homo sapiens]|uniref:uncharacterized protein C9orf85 isoform X2 n=1 Tax=Homo sapiens TaxID=9606 RepID=UPI001FB06FA6|nr:uncharacterized protein C9orf85 isoform X2 [Homo sapiens]XP_054217949.1 uncharacterized protein C9orf85 isoform X2 [Homo sapiens]